MNSSETPAVSIAGRPECIVFYFTSFLERMLTVAIRYPSAPTDAQLGQISSLIKQQEDNAIVSRHVRDETMVMVSYLPHRTTNREILTWLQTTFNPTVPFSCSLVVQLLEEGANAHLTFHGRRPDENQLREILAALTSKPEVASITATKNPETFFLAFNAAPEDIEQRREFFGDAIANQPYFGLSVVILTEEMQPVSDIGLNKQKDE